ncbi:MAG TPA: TonB-dependent receptor [Gemmatimonadales bacterium]|nr:TonB-dependent receptor [Gemmatimonadales bacterium]
MLFSVRPLFAFTSVLLLGGGALAAQATGKIQGSVTGSDGQGLVHAQVVIVGTAFGAATDDKGYYFINNVPPGTYSLRAQFIGYAPTQLTDVRVLGGQTLTQNFPLKATAVSINGINIQAAANPLVPRDEVTSKAIVSQETFSNLPVDNVRSVITLQPGVVESGNNNGVSIRGGRPGEANVYIDGAPVRSVNGNLIGTQGMTGSQGTSIQTNAVEEASVTTGALPVQFGDAQSGVINYTTRAGGEKLAGSFSTQSDGMMPNSISAGYNRFEGTLGGPVPGINNLRFFMSGVLQGQVSPYRSQGASDVASYTTAGIDTIVNVSSTTTPGLEQIAVPRFVQFSGSCDAAKNDGFACQGMRLPDNWNTTINLQGKLTYFYGSGSSVALSALAGGQQFRNWPGTLIDDPAGQIGNHNWQRTYTLNWNHQLFKSADRALSFNVVASYGTDQLIQGILDPTSDVSTQNPLGGIELSTLNFGLGSFADLFFNDPDQVVKNVRTNSGLRVPLLGQTQYTAAQPYRLNPYGMESGAFFTQGLDATGTTASNQLYKESRLYGTANVDWQANRYHRFTFGGELKRSDVAYWNAFLTNQIFMNVYHDKPVSGAAWASDRLDLGDVVIDLGVRYDYFNSEALFPLTPGFVFSDPNWNPALNSTSPDALYQASVSKVFTPGLAHTAVSPRIGVSFPITDQTDFHLSYSHQVQSPDLNAILQGVNNDLTFTNANQANGRDVGFGKTILFEFGARHAFSPDFVVDVSAYNKSKVADLSYRLFQYNDPTNPGRMLSVNVLTSGDFGYDRGLDVKLDRRVGNWLSASLAYTYEIAQGTGSSPLSYLNTNARSISGVTGTVLPPAEQARAVDDQRTHNVVGAVSFSVPQGWQSGTTVGNIFSKVSAFATFRVLSGLPYTPLVNSGGGATAPGTNFGLTATQAGDINSATTPWTKYLDLRINKGLQMGRLQVTAFADIRNLFNWKNITGLFAETNDVTNAIFQHNRVAAEFVNLANEAKANGALDAATQAVKLPVNCGTWQGEAGPVDCVELKRTEARFGNGDGVYTLSEQTNALNSYYNLFNGPYTFNDLGRQMRLGFELNF